MPIGMESHFVAAVDDWRIFHATAPEATAGARQHIGVERIGNIFILRLVLVVAALGKHIEAVAHLHVHFARNGEILEECSVTTGITVHPVEINRHAAKIEMITQRQIVDVSALGIFHHIHRIFCGEPRSNGAIPHEVVGKHVFEALGRVWRVGHLQIQLVALAYAITHVHTNLIRVAMIPVVAGKIHVNRGIVVFAGSHKHHLLAHGERVAVGGRIGEIHPVGGIEERFRVAVVLIQAVTERI